MVGGLSTPRRLVPADGGRPGSGTCTLCTAGLSFASEEEHLTFGPWTARRRAGPWTARRRAGPWKLVPEAAAALQGVPASVHDPVATAASAPKGASSDPALDPAIIAASDPGPRIEGPATTKNAVPLPPWDEPQVMSPPPDAPAVALPASDAPAVALPPSHDPTVAWPPSDAPAVAWPASDAPAVALPPSDAPAVALPPSDAPAVALPPSDASAVALPPSDAPAVALPPSDAPAVAWPASDAPAVALPPSDAPAVALPPSDASPVALLGSDDPAVALPSSDDPLVALPSSDDPRVTLPPSDDPLVTARPRAYDPDALPLADDPLVVARSSGAASVALPPSDDPLVALPSAASVAPAALTPSDAPSADPEATRLPPWPAHADDAAFLRTPADVSAFAPPLAGGLASPVDPRDLVADLLDAPVAASSEPALAAGDVADAHWSDPPSEPVLPADDAVESPWSDQLSVDVYDSTSQEESFMSIPPQEDLSADLKTSVDEDEPLAQMPGAYMPSVDDGLEDEPLSDADLAPVVPSLGMPEDEDLSTAETLVDRLEVAPDPLASRVVIHPHPQPAPAAAALGVQRAPDASPSLDDRLASELPVPSATEDLDPPVVRAPLPVGMSVGPPVDASGASEPAASSVDVAALPLATADEIAALTSLPSWPPVSEEPSDVDLVPLSNVASSYRSSTPYEWDEDSNFDDDLELVDDDQIQVIEEGEEVTVVERPPGLAAGVSEPLIAAPIDMGPPSLDSTVMGEEVDLEAALEAAIMTPVEASLPLPRGIVRLESSPDVAREYLEHGRAEAQQDAVRPVQRLRGHDVPREPGEVTPLARISLIRRPADIIEGTPETPPTAIPSRRNRAPLPHPSRQVIGVDMGTATTATAAVINGHPGLLPSTRGAPVVPSSVLIEPSGRTFVGEAAARKLPWFPKLGIAGPGRLLGRVYGGPAARGWTSELTCDIDMGDDGEVAAVFGPHVVSIEEVVALLLKEIRSSATVSLRETVNRAVLTCPTFFGARQRQALRLAGQLAGFHVERIVPGPLAAAVELTKGRIRPGRVMVIDCGAGALDVGLVEVTPEGYTLVAARGSHELGGDAYDQLMVRHLASLTDDLEGAAGIGGYFDIREAAELGKWTLTEQETARLEVARRDPTDGQDQWRLDAEIHRHEAEALFEPLVARTIQLCQSLCDEAYWPLDSLDTVIPIGGQARMPMLLARLRALFTGALTIVDSTTVQPYGAARIAERIAEQRPIRLAEVVPQTISLGRRDGSLDVLLARGQRLGMRVERMLRIEQASDLDLFLFEGDGTNVIDAEPLLRLKLPRSAVLPFTARFTLDMSEEGEVRFDAVDGQTGAELALSVDVDLSREAIRSLVGAAGQLVAVDDLALEDDSVFAWLLKRLSQPQEASAEPVLSPAESSL